MFASDLLIGFSNMARKAYNSLNIAWKTDFANFQFFSLLLQLIESSKSWEITWRKLSSDEVILNLVRTQAQFIAVHVLKKLQEKLKFGQSTT